jgi:hypothetical protein
MADTEIRCQVHKHFGVVNPVYQIGYGRIGSYELNFVSWNGGEAQFDLRAWTDDTEHPVTKGTRFTLEDAKELHKILGSAIEEMSKPPEVKKPSVILIKKNSQEVKA